MNIENVKMISNSNNATYFYKQNLDRKNSDSIFISLSKNIRFNQMGRKELSVDIFKKYFDLTKYQKLMFVHYRKYRMYNNSEEKMLGFFRILENIMFSTETMTQERKEILQRYGLFPKKRKIRDDFAKIKFTLFFEEMISLSLKEILKFTMEDLHSIVSFRNDIVHLNEYDYDENILKKHINYLEFLTTYILLKRIGYSEEDFIANLKFYKNSNNVLDQKIVFKR